MLSKAVCARVAAAFCLAFISPVWAMPSIDPDIDKRVLEWSTFDIAGNESINFAQSTKDSIILARIGSEGPTRISGSLTTNGSLFLVNPNGFYFDSGSNVAASRLYLSTDPLAFDSFQRDGLSSFAPQGGDVTFDGIINADFVGVWAGGSIAVLSGATITASESVFLVSDMVVIESDSIHITAVPEPQPLTTLLAGLGILSIVSLRRNRSS